MDGLTAVISSTKLETPVMGPKRNTLIHTHAATVPGVQTRFHERHMAEL